MKPAFDDPARRWQLGLAVLIGVFVLGTLTSLVLAERRVSRIVDADYYDHGLHYAETMRRNQQARHWSITPTLAQGVLRVEVRGKNGTPVAGGDMEFLPRQGNTPETVKIKLWERTPGVYTVAAAGSSVRHGSIRFTKGGATLDAQVVLFE